MNANRFSIKLTAVLILCLALFMPFSKISADNSPLCFTARNGSVTVRFDIKNVTHTIQYSTDSINWLTYTSNQNVIISANQSIYFRAASDQTTATAFGTSDKINSSRFYFSSSDDGTAEGSGNIMSLYGPSCPNLPLQPCSFAYMFANCSSLTVAPVLSSIVMADSCYKSLFDSCVSLTVPPELPAMSLARHCYHNMFKNCSSLNIAPLLPATTLAENCYCYMFYGCTSLTTPPALPATELANGCYHDMFKYCSGLLVTPELPATTLAEHCYERMFYYCTSLVSLPELPATTLSSCCYYRMFWGCSSLIINTTCPGHHWAIRVNTTADNALSNMFYGTGGTMHGTPSPNSIYYIASDTTPIIPLCFTAKGGKVTVRFDIKNVTHTIQYSTDGDNWTNYFSYKSITLNAGGKVYFRAATNQTNSARSFGSHSMDESSRFYFTSSNGGVVEGSGNIMSLYGPDCPAVLPYAAFANMFYQCTLLTTAPVLPSTCMSGYCYSDMFRDCTSLTKAPELSATILAEKCYAGMFCGCTSLTSAPLLPASTLAYACYEYMFNGCSSLSMTPTLPANTLANSCYEGMFVNCTSLITALELPAIKLEERCYFEMFRGCISLITPPVLPANTLALQSYGDMFMDCRSLTIPPELPADTLANRCYERMFSGCSSLTVAPSLPAITISAECYGSMFEGCTSLTVPPSLPATTLTSQCYSGMFENCTSLIINTEGPGKQWIIPASSSYAYLPLGGMFTGTSGTMNGTPTVNTTYYIASCRHLLTTAVNDTVFGRVVGAGTYIEGEVATSTAISNPHYHFLRWSDGDTANPRNITIISDTSLFAIFELDKHIITGNGTNGMVNGVGTYDYGSTATLTAMPDNHYYFSGWSDGVTTNPRTITVSCDTTFIAVFEGNMHTISANGLNGVVSGGGLYHYGSTTTLTATADEHYHFKQWSDGNTLNPRTVNVTGNATYTAIFEIDKHIISGTGTNGLVSGGGSYDYGSTATLTAAGNAHYHFVQWSDGNTSNPRTVNVTGNTTYTAIFEIDSHIVNVIGENGTVTGSGTYNYGTSVPLTATANEHYHFVSWSDGNTSSTRTIIVEGDTTYTAIFEIDKHNVTATTTNGTIAGLGEYDYGATVSLTAIPDDYYCHVNWSDGDTSLVKSFVITGDVNFTADFTKCQYVITATCEHGTVTGSGTYENPDVVTLTVTPDEGYRFVKWSDDNEYNPRVFVAREDLTVEAICEEAPIIDDVENVQADTPAFYIIGNTIYNPDSEPLRVYSAEGKLLRTADTDIDMFGYPAGIYIVTDNRGNSVRVAVK